MRTRRCEWPLSGRPRPRAARTAYPGIASDHGHDSGRAHEHRRASFRRLGAVGDRPDRAPLARARTRAPHGRGRGRAIRRLAIRGAPLIGVAGAYGVVLRSHGTPRRRRSRGPATSCEAARPTAVNLSAAVDRVHRTASAAGTDRLAAALDEARAIEAEEEAASDSIAAHGAELLAGARRDPHPLQHRRARGARPRHGARRSSPSWPQRGTLESVLATESRPLLQGARLTTYELARLNIPHELIVDSAAAGLIAGGAVDAVIVGCDRVAANGDVANKVGTYGLALAARAADIPFVVAGPTSTIDPNAPDGAHIAIEERDPDEVRIAGRPPHHARGHPLPEPRLRRHARGARHRARHRARNRPVPRRGGARRASRRHDQMRVARSFAPGDVRIEDAPEPEPGPGEVVCDVLACGVCGSDVTDWYIAPRLPAVLGHEVDRNRAVGRRRRHRTGPRRRAWPSTTTPRAASAGVAGAATRRCASGSARRGSTPAGSPSACGSCPELVPELLELPDGLDPIDGDVHRAARVRAPRPGPGGPARRRLAARSRRGRQWPAPDRGRARPGSRGGVGARAATRAPRASRGVGRRAPRQRARRRRDRVHAQARGDRVGGRQRWRPAARSACTRHRRRTRRPGSTPPRCTCARSRCSPATRPAPATCGRRSS